MENPKAPRPERPGLRRTAAHRAGHRAAADLPVRRIGSAAPAGRRMIALLIASALLGGVIGGIVVFATVGAPWMSRSPGASRAPDRSSAPLPDTSARPGGQESSALATARRLQAAGKLREAQEEYLAILLIDPTHDEAMRGLVRVVGLIAKGNRAALRRQAEEYRRAVELGVETEEHYTAPAMELLARANLQAAGVRVSELPPRPRAEPAPAPPAATRPTPAPRPEPTPTAPPRTERQRPAPRTPPAQPAQPVPAPEPAPTAQPAPPPPAAVNVNEPFVTVVIGPVSSSDRASAITGELTIAGYAARLRRQAAGTYVITLGPYRQSEAARAAGYVRSRFGQSVPVSLSPAP